MERREKVNLILSDNFSSGMARAKAATIVLSARLARDAATWEPIDWSEFD